MKNLKKYIMKPKLLIDTSFLYKLIIERNEKLLKVFEDYDVYVPVNVLEEISFKIIIVALSNGSYKFFEIKKKYEKGEEEFKISSYLHFLNNLLNFITVLDLNKEIFELAKEIMLEYKLLPNDALIAATCKYYGIKKIATFDEDFKRVDFLEIIEL